MANTNAPFGFRPLGNTDGASPTFGLISRKIASNDTTAIYKNDPVKNLNTGYVSQWTASTAASQLAGIFTGCEYRDSATGEWKWSQHWPGGGNTGDAIAYLLPCVGSVPPKFLVQSSGTAITLADIGANADVSVGTGSTVTHISGATLNQGTLDVTATLPFRVIGIYSDVGVGAGSDSTSSYNWVIVQANVSGAGATGI